MGVCALFLMVSWVCLQSVIVALTGYTHLRFEGRCVRRTMQIHLSLPHHNHLQSWYLKCMDHIPGIKNILEDAFTQLNEDIELSSCLVHILQLASTLCELSNKS